MVLRDVDLTGSDRAFMSVELFQDLGFGALGSADTNGFVVGDVWDDLAMIEVGSEETGWSVINCPVSAYISGACFSVSPCGEVSTLIEPTRRTLSVDMLKVYTTTEYTLSTPSTAGTTLLTRALELSI